MEISSFGVVLHCFPCQLLRLRRLTERESGEGQTQQQLHYDAKRATACECIADPVYGCTAVTPHG